MDIFKRFAFSSVLWLLYAMHGYVMAQQQYPIHYDAIENPSVPKGIISGPFYNYSKVLKGTVHEYWIYVPQQYSNQKANQLTVVFDGINMAKNWNLPTVFDNLISKNEIPVTIGLFISPGIKTAKTDNVFNKPNRSVEYDGTGSLLPDIIMTEIIPAIMKQYAIAANNNLVMGNSSGGNAAFNMAWERSDFFQRVYSGIGSFTGLRSGEDFPVLIRKTEQKPIRIFLQDGSKDLNNFSGEWFAVNQHMLSSLQWAGYEVNHAWGDDGHNPKHGAAIMPDILRWLWKDFPTPIVVGKNSKSDFNFLQPDEKWKLIKEFDENISSLTTDLSGELLIASGKDIWLHDLNNSFTKKYQLPKQIVAISSTASGSYLYSLEGEQSVQLRNVENKVLQTFSGIYADDLLCYGDGFYWTNKKQKTIGRLDFKTKQKSIYSFQSIPTGLSLHPEKSFLYANRQMNKLGSLFTVDSLFELSDEQAYLHYQLVYPNYNVQPGKMIVDTNNYVITCTDIGLQVADQLGRTNLIIPLPQNEKPATLALAGRNRNTLYASSGNKLYARIVKSQGFLPQGKTVKPPRPQHINNALPKR